MLLKRPGFTLVAALTLALGIGATTALFSVVYGVLISPYPYAKPEGIWTPGLRTAQSNQRMRPYRLNEYLEMAKLPVFADVMATSPGRALLTGEYSPETLQANRVSGNAFNFLGVPPMLGRTIQPSDIRPTGEPEPVTVLSFRRWQRLFGGDPNAIGKTLRLNDQPHIIIDVMPPRFGWWTDSGVWLPLGTVSRDSQVVFPITRLKPEVSPAAAEQQLHSLQFAYWITQLMVALMPSFFVPNEARIEVNRYVLFFCVTVSALTGILFGLAPALQSSRPDLVAALKDDARGSGASAGGRTRAALVVIEVALSVVLLVGAGLTIRSFIALQQVDLGFRPERVMSVGLPLPPQRYATWEQRNRFARELLERVKSLEIGRAHV